MSAIRRRVKAHGRVQGVFFRDSMREEAQARGVTGWIRNTDDGAVEAVFEGESDDVEALLWFMRSGPDSADVDRMDVDEEEPEGLRRFEVRA
jgi:acylphosphatase